MEKIFYCLERVISPTKSPVKLWAVVEHNSIEPKTRVCRFFLANEKSAEEKAEKIISQIHPRMSKSDKATELGLNKL